MGILSFGMVMGVFRRSINDATWPGQLKFFCLLFRDYVNDKTDGGIDEGLTSKRMNGKAPLNKEFVNYYKENTSQRNLQTIIAEEILPMMYDSAMAVQVLKGLLINVTNISDEKRIELEDSYSFDDNDKAAFITEVLCLAIQVPFVDPELQLQIPKNKSTSVVGHLYNTEIPAPCKFFVGRDDELDALHALLLEHGKVFLYGVPGIGKSEVAKKYARCHRSEYTNIIYLHYSGNLRQTIARVVCAYDRPVDDENTRFVRHSSFLQSLFEDTLLVIDNFNVTATEDPFLDELLEYRCRILFTTRCRYDDYDPLKLTELSKDDLLTLVSKFYPETQNNQEEIDKIIELLHKHTFVVELAARLLDKGILNPRALRRKLEINKIAMDIQDRFFSKKDGKGRKATYYEHIHCLFALYNFTSEEREILRSMTLIPAGGIDPRSFAQWMKQENMNIINNLVEMGYIHLKDDRDILMHPMIREVAIEELKPSVRNCSVLLESLQEISQKHELDFPNYRQMFHTAEQILVIIENDDPKRYLVFLEEVFEYMDKYRYELGMQAVLDEMNKILTDPSVGTSKDRACVLGCAAALEKDLPKQIELGQKAILTLGAVNFENARLASNLFQNLGALYYRAGYMELGQRLMARAMCLLKEYNLLNCHDSIVQICSQASVLTDLGDGLGAYQKLEELAETIRETNSDQCLDYGTVLQTMASVCLVMGDEENASKYYKQAMKIYEQRLAGEPAVLEEKRAEIKQELLMYMLSK